MARTVNEKILARSNARESVRLTEMGIKRKRSNKNMSF
jgi:hypothetical protein